MLSGETDCIQNINSCQDPFWWREACNNRHWRQYFKRTSCFEVTPEIKQTVHPISSTANYEDREIIFAFKIIRKCHKKLSKISRSPFEGCTFTVWRSFATCDSGFVPRRHIIYFLKVSTIVEWGNWLHTKYKFLSGLVLMERGV